MNGIVGIISNRNKNYSMLKSFFNNVDNYFEYENLFISYKGNNKFLKDKIFKENDVEFILTDGLILNSSDISNQFATRSLFDSISILNRNYVDFPVNLKGDFSGCIYNKSKQILKIFSNPINSKPIYYYHEPNENIFIYSSYIKNIVDILKVIFEKKITLSTRGAYYLLTHGYMLEDETIIDKIRKIPPASILTFNKRNSEMKIDQYFRINNTKMITLSEDKIIDRLHELFLQAVKQEYDKDLEYEYEHLATLSGGLDSRINVFAANHLGYKDITNITYSQTGHRDEIYPRKMSADLKSHQIFFSLDYGNYLKDIEKPVRFNDGLIISSGAAHQLKVVSSINWENYGMLHTGHLGGADLGSYLLDKFHTKTSSSLYAYSQTLINKIQPELDNIFSNYENDEMFLFYNRGINGIVNGYLMTAPYTDFASPFMDLDFLKFCFSIPPKYRFKRYIYVKWLQQKFPRAAKFKWAATGLSLYATKNQIKIFNYWRRAKRKLGIAQLTSSMNPYDYWFNNNSTLQHYYEKYFAENLKYLEPYKELQTDASDLFKNGSFSEKSQSLTLIAAAKYHLK